MPYIGNQPAEQFTSFATQEFSTSATTSYTLDHAVTNENEIALFVNNVRQQPGSGKAYTATGTALTLSAATASTDTMYCVFLGRALQTVTPATNSITAAMVGNDLISGKDALTSSPADTDELLISDAGVLKRIDVSLVGGKNTPAFIASGGSGNQTINHASGTTINYGQEILDTDSAFDISTDVFTVPSGKAGKYIFQASCQIEDTQADIQRFVLEIQKNDSSWRQIAHRFTSNNDLMQVSHTITAMDDASAADEYKAKVYVETADSGSVIIENGSTSYSNNWFQGFRLIT